MASHLSADQIGRIVSLVNTWPEGTQLTWEALGTLVVRDLGLRPARSTLSRNKEIAVAYRTRKGHLREGLDTPAFDRFPTKRLERLTAENAQLKCQVQLLEEQFVRWQYNARKHGMTRAQLDARMPFADRR